MKKVNGVDTEQYKPFFDRIENLDADLDSEKGAFMNRCKVIKDDKKEVFAEAEESGLSKKALKALVEYRKLERKQSEVGSDLEGEDEKIFDALADQLGALGEAAKAAHTKAKTSSAPAHAH